MSGKYIIIAYVSHICVVRVKWDPGARVLGKVWGLLHPCAQFIWRRRYTVPHGHHEPDQRIFRERLREWEDAQEYLMVQIQIPALIVYEVQFKAHKG